MATGTSSNVGSVDGSAYTNVDPDGDLVITVGSSSPRSFRVSAKVLSVASDVFRKMFGPNFKEGSSLAKRYRDDQCGVCEK